jgi:hypothetical protein
MPEPMPEPRPDYRPPAAGEHAPYYATYTDLVRGDDLLALLAAQPAGLDRLLVTAAGRGDHRYAPDKWSVKEVLGHVADAERVFAYRALAIARLAEGDVPGMDQEAWMAAADFASQTLEELAAELRAVRAASLSLFHGFSDLQLERRGLASGVEFTVNALAWIVAGHWRHHWRILEERYGVL